MNNRFILRLIIYVLALAIAIYVLLDSTKRKKNQSEKTHIPIEVYYPPDTTRLTRALDICDSLKYRRDFVLLMDLTQHSGNFRFFGLNLENNDTLIKALVAHGHCQSTDNRFAQFSNEVGSNCSSTGKFRIGKKYEGQFGTSFKLHGLDSSNSNAFERFVVLHSHPCVPDIAQDDDICLSEGCPTVSPTALNQLLPFLNNSPKPVLLWIYKNRHSL